MPRICRNSFKEPETHFNLLITKYFLENNDFSKFPEDPKECEIAPPRFLESPRNENLRELQSLFNWSYSVIKFWIFFTKLHLREKRKTKGIDKQEKYFESKIKKPNLKFSIQNFINRTLCSSAQPIQPTLPGSHHQPSSKNHLHRRS